MADLTRVGIVVGMRSEARLAAALATCPWVLGIEIGGGTAAGGSAAARRLLARGADGLVSFGLAAGLVDDAPAGTLLCPREVVIGHMAYGCDPALAARLRVAGARDGALLHSDRVVADPAEKRALATASGCIGLDMESGGVATAASEAGVAFAVLRAVCDPVDRALPAAAANALGADGGVAVGRLLGAVLRRPATIGALLALGADAAQARAALRTALRAASARGARQA